MGTTYRKLLQALVTYRYSKFRSDSERDAARLQAIEEALQGLLEKLSDEETQ